MKKLLALLLLITVLVSIGASNLEPAASRVGPPNNIQARALQVELGQAKAAKFEQKLSSKSDRSHVVL